MSQPHSPQLLSVHVGRPRHVVWKGRSVLTGIFKEPVHGPVVARRLNLDGDRQADLTAHGGPDKAVYVYPVEHYDAWRRELAPTEVLWGMFGENLTTRGLTEESVLIGERLEIGQALFVVTQPRQPCYKLAVRFGRDDILRRFVRSRRTGWYLAVEREGAVAAGDAIIRLGAPSASLSVATIAELLFAERPDIEVLRGAAALPGLAGDVRAYFQGLVAQQR